MKSKTKVGNTEYLGVDSKLDFDILLWRQMERIHATDDLNKKIMMVDDLHNMLIAWSEDDKEYKEDIKPAQKLWDKAHMSLPAFDFYKKKYHSITYPALVNLMHRLSILGEMSVIPPREEMTTL